MTRELEKIKDCENEIKEIRMLARSIMIAKAKQDNYMDIDTVVISGFIIRAADSLIEVLEDEKDVEDLENLDTNLLNRVYNAKRKGEDAVYAIKDDMENFTILDTVWEDITDSIEWYLLEGEQ